MNTETQGYDLIKYLLSECDPSTWIYYPQELSKKEEKPFMKIVERYLLRQKVESGLCPYCGKDMKRSDPSYAGKTHGYYACEICNTEKFWLDDNGLFEGQ